MAKLTLDETWKNCLAMYTWIAEVWKKGDSIITLKRQWLDKHMPDVWVQNDCFFCDYAQNRGGCGNGCPGKLVDWDFDCCSDFYNYEDKPKKFCEELVRLNKIR